jgi:predicted RNase H-like HicB family nuclease
MAPRARPQTLRESVRFERSGRWWVAELPGFPGAYSQGKTQDAAYLNLLSAIQDLAAAYAEQAAPGIDVTGTDEFTRRKVAAAKAAAAKAKAVKGRAAPPRKLAAKRA